MDDEKKSGLSALVIGVGKPKAKGEPKDEGDSPKRIAAQGLIDAVKGGDAAEVEDAFQTMYDACAMKSAPAEIDD